MFYIFKVIYKYRHIMPELIEFIELCTSVKSTNGGLTKSESSKLMKQYWVLVKKLSA